MGRAECDIDQPPGKWEVYEQILRIPYYVVFSRYTNRLQVFGLAGSRYQECSLAEGKIWLSELGLGLGVWSGIYQGLERQWLRWYDAEQVWIPTPVEREHREIERERRRAEQERQRAEPLAAQLRKLGIEPED